jgi:6-phosphogluconate dehydrogenase
VYNRSVEKVDAFLQGRAKGKTIRGVHTLEELVNSLARPRKVMMMVKAGKPVDDLIEQLIPLLEPGDVIIDGGNSHFPDTTRRTRYVESKGLLYIGTGVSGGEEGALLGPSIMPGGSKAAWPLVKPVFQAIAAKVADGTPCCDWVGEDGAGHFVKMVHNGIEYGDMQLICEAYQIMKDLYGMTAPEMHEAFKEWNGRELGSYLIEITSDILAFNDEDGQPLVEKILDTAGQKGTGKWTGITAFDLGVPLTLIAESVYARCLSAMKDERVVAAKAYRTDDRRPMTDENPELLAKPSPHPHFTPTLTPDSSVVGRRSSVLNDLRQALYAAKITSYAQGYMLMKAAAEENGWILNYGGIAQMWRGGCIIRSVFLDKIKAAFVLDPDLPNLLLDPYFKQEMINAQGPWRNVVTEAIMKGIPVPAFAAALTFFDGYKTERLPANLLQAQRDYFGAHTYERIDHPRGEFFHTNWTGRGGTTASTTYNA